MISLANLTKIEQIQNLDNVYNLYYTHIYVYQLYIFEIFSCIVFSSAALNLKPVIHVVTTHYIQPSSFKIIQHATANSLSC